MTGTPSSAQGYAELVLRDYKRIMRLLEDCGSARSPDSFREAVLDGFARHLGYRNTTFFVGDTPSAVFSDPSPVTAGRASRMVPAYVETFHSVDPFAALARSDLGRLPSPLSLDFLVDRRHPGHREYLDRFLFRHGIFAKVVIPIQGPDGAAAIGWLAEEAGRFGPMDLARAAALAPHLGNLFALHLGCAEQLPEITGLTVRQAEVARMVVSGATNRQIAAALFITVDTVKKHLSSVYSVTGCTSRTQLAAARRNGRSPA
jgi:DNA-binding CsgD family transcriptional regulator